MQVLNGILWLIQKNKVIEEFDELSLELEGSDSNKIEEEFGDFLFSVIN